MHCSMRASLTQPLADTPSLLLSVILALSFSLFQIIQTSNSPNPLPVLVVANRPQAQEGAIKKIEDGTVHDVFAC